jgi:hypothetical protein
MKNKNSSRGRRRLKPMPSPAMYLPGEAKVVDGSPVDYVRAYVEELGKWLCQTGALKRWPASKRHPPAGYAGAMFAGRRYSIRERNEPGKKEQVNLLIQLWFAGERLAEAYTIGDRERSCWWSLEAGELVALIKALGFDRVVGVGRRRMEIDAIRNKEAADKNRLPPEKAQKVIELSQQRKTWGQIERMTGVSQSSIARILRRNKVVPRR